MLTTPDTPMPELQAAAQNFEIALAAAETADVDHEALWQALWNTNNRLSEALQTAYGDEWDDIADFDGLAERFIVQRNRYVSAMGLPIPSVTEAQSKPAARKKAKPKTKDQAA